MPRVDLYTSTKDVCLKVTVNLYWIFIPLVVQEVARVISSLKIDWSNPTGGKKKIIL